ncbi:Smr/MutS family protein [Pseudokordiimonas caeni]|uniref:Smr/MutS family protein n=1 Tax=Pseudokordiimonas caeni TaxID=2997908 RepID=UPI002810B6C5|nr:Smr/MutS family protein [Pseudokordiimonas caeni]
MPGGRKRPRKPAAPPELTGEDATLWEALAASVRPLKGRPKPPPLSPRRPDVPDRGADRLPDEWFREGGPAPTPGIDRKTRRRIAKGHTDVDRALDLHGMTQDGAYNALKGAIEGAIRRGDKTLLVVTGKGGARFNQIGALPAMFRRREDFEQHGGVLRRMLPLWLEASELRPFVESYGPAADEHGGDGAFYIRLRKRLPGSRRKTGDEA